MVLLRRVSRVVGAGGKRRYSALVAAAGELVGLLALPKAVDARDVAAKASRRVYWVCP